MFRDPTLTLQWIQSARTQLKWITLESFSFILLFSLDDTKTSILIFLKCYWTWSIKSLSICILFELMLFLYATSCIYIFRDDWSKFLTSRRFRDKFGNICGTYALPQPAYTSSVCHSFQHTICHSDGGTKRSDHSGRQGMYHVMSLSPDQLWASIQKTGTVRPRAICRYLTPNYISLTYVFEYFPV